MEITRPLDAVDEVLHSLEAVGDLHFRQGCLYVLEITLSGGGTLIQNGDDTGVGFRSDRSAEALLQLDLHLRHHHRSDKQPESGMVLPLFCVRDGERQAWDDQQGKNEIQVNEERNSDEYKKRRHPVRMPSD